MRKISRDFLLNHTITKKDRFFINQLINYNQNEYYEAGIIFLFLVLLVLIYANFYYEYCFTNFLFKLSKSRLCICLKCFFKNQKKNTSYLSFRDNQNNNNNNNNKNNLDDKYLVYDQKINKSTKLICQKITQV